MTPRPARLLDISRLLSRAGRGLTGVDRVELAYLDALIADPVPLYGLARTALGFVLVDQAALKDLRPFLAGERPWGAPKGLARLARKLSKERQGAESAIRQAAAARALPARLGAMLKRELPEGTAYLNVGHSNLSRKVLGGVKAIPGARITVLIHDMIPLDFPQFQRDGTVEVFRQKMTVAMDHADHLIFNSQDTARRVRHHFGDAPPGTVAHLGCEDEKLRAALTRPKPPVKRPYFVALGTIEPRKNHGFLLDLWDQMEGDERPDLRIIGARGWKNEAVFQRLDSLAQNARISELQGLQDAEVFDQIRGAAGLLMPSLAEGYGLPLLEAAALGTPILANDLPVYREFLENIPVYASVNDRYLWLRTIKRMTAEHEANTHRQTLPEIGLPDWETHFNRVLKVT